MTEGKGARTRSSWASRLQRLRHMDIAHDTFWSFVSRGGRAAMSLGTFLVVTRALGVRDYGYFAGILAFAGVCMPLANFGAGHLVMQRVSRDVTELRDAWGDALLSSSVGAMATLLVVLTLGPVLIPDVPLSTTVALAASELLFVSIGEVASYAYAAQRRFRASAIIMTTYGAARFIAVFMLYLLVEGLGLRTVAYTVLGVAVVHCTIVGLILTFAAPPRFDLRRAGRAMFSGGNYMVSLFSDRLQSDVDKTMLVWSGMPVAAGIYTAGYRVVSYSLMPAASLIQASYPRFFVRGGSGGIDQTWRYALRLLRPIVIYSGIAIGALMLLAEPLAAVIGDDYDEVAVVITLMAPLLALQGIRTNMSNALTGAGFQAYRTGVFTGAAIFNACLNLALIPRYSWQGAMFATYLTEALLIGTTVWIIRLKRRTAAPSNISDTSGATFGTPR